MKTGAIKHFVGSLEQSVLDAMARWAGTLEIEVIRLNAIYIEVLAEVRYWEDSAVNGIYDDDGTKMPKRSGDCWNPVIRLGDGAVMEWPQGTTADVHYKVCDQGEYWLLDENRTRIAKWNGCYVPDDFLCHGSGSGYGDYIIMKIDENGVIKDYQQPLIKVAQGEDSHGWKKI